MCEPGTDRASAGRGGVGDLTEPAGQLGEVRKAGALDRADGLALLPRQPDFDLQFGEFLA